MKRPSLSITKEEEEDTFSNLYPQIKRFNHKIPFEIQSIIYETVHGNIIKAKCAQPRMRVLAVLGGFFLIR